MGQGTEKFGRSFTGTLIFCAEVCLEGQGGETVQIRLSEVLTVIGIGLAAMVGSLQLDQQLSVMNLGVAMGPAKYTMVISLVILVCGALLGIKHLRRRKLKPANVTPPIASSRGGLLIAVLLGYVAAVPFLGFVIGSLCFFPLLFQVCGMRSWFKSIVFGMVMGGCFYVVFVMLAKLPVPKGGIGF